MTVDSYQFCSQKDYIKVKTEVFQKYLESLFSHVYWTGIIVEGIDLWLAYLYMIVVTYILKLAEKNKTFCPDAKFLWVKNSL